MAWWTAFLALVLFGVPKAEGQTDPSDQAALVALFEGLAPSSRELLGWDTSSSLCEQDRVTCNGTRVTRLGLSGLTLEGSIASEIGDLQGLQELDLSGNQLTGTVPTEIATLAEMSLLSLSNNSLWGPVPEDISTLPLFLLNLAGNRFCPLADYSAWAAETDFAHANASCPNGGACENSTCICPGFVQPYCLDDEDECAGEPPCHENATCTNMIGSFACQCNTGFTGNGNECQDVDECSQSPCHANATCTNLAGSYSCTCNSGFAGNGTHCQDVDECREATALCSLGTVCVNNEGGFTCQCAQGFVDTGAGCSPGCIGEDAGGAAWPETLANATLVANCSTPLYSVFAGSVANLSLTATRSCLSEGGEAGASWSPEPCQATCRKSGCQNNGTCVAYGSGMYCACLAGFRGRYCEEPGAQRCPDIPCAHGTCVNPTNLTAPGYCRCISTVFSGVLCHLETSACASSPCRNRATCTDDPFGGYDCSCQPGFLGSECELCDLSTCEHGGRCVIKGDGVLECDCSGTGFMGRTCQIIQYNSLGEDSVLFDIIVPVALVFLAFVVFLAWSNRATIKEHLKWWPGLFAHALLCCISYFDFLSDLFFVLASFHMMMEEEGAASFFLSSIVFLGVSWSTTLLLTVMVHLLWVRQIGAFLSSHPSVPPSRARIPLGFFFGFTLMSNDGLDVFHLAAKYLFPEQGFNLAPYAPYLGGFFASKVLLQDLPLLIIQSLFHLRTERATTVTIFSLITTCVSLFFSLSLFGLSLALGGLRGWATVGGWAHFTLRPRAGAGGTGKKEDETAPSLHNDIEFSNSSPPRSLDLPRPLRS